ncbi:MAG: transcriptional regulator [Microbacterium sp.]|nr:transcriptional regulator [Microbacterium sp.]
MATYTEQMPSERAVESTSEQVFLTLRNEIMQGEMPPGSRHSIYTLADRLGVSRTPVREAVLRLADINLVTIERNRGVVVRRISLADMESAFEMRFLVEGGAVSFLATPDARNISADLAPHTTRMRAALDIEDVPAFVAADRAWHDTLVAAMENPWMQSQIQNLRFATPPPPERVQPPHVRLGAILEEHAAITDAIADGDRRVAVDAMRSHLRKTARSLVPHADRADLSDAWPATLARHYPA